MAHKCKCDECNWFGKSDELLQAGNPFDFTEFIYGCPECKSIDCFTRVCEHEGCKSEASGGHPTVNGYATFSGNLASNGYIYTCYKHHPSKEPQNQRPNDT